jgi:hypothetical protein
MPKVTGPLFSNSASGSISKLLTYRKTNGTNICRKWAKPTGTVSELQSAVRAITKSIMQTWPTLSDNEKDSWDALTDNGNISGINAFQQYNFSRVIAGKSIARTYPPSENYTIYSNGSATPDLAFWTPTFSSGGQLSLDGSSVISSSDLTSLSIDDLTILDGIFDFRGLTELEVLELTIKDFSVAPKIANCSKLYNYNISGCPVTTFPDFTGCTALEDINFTNCHLTEVDSIFLWAVENVNLEITGSIMLTGTNNASVTDASLAARTAMTAPYGSWSLFFNS